MTENERFVYMNLLETEAISVSDEECYYFNEFGTVKKICKLLNKFNDENEQLKKDLKESQKLKNKRLRRVKNQRAVLEEIGGVIIGYKSQLRDLHHKIDKIKEAMEDTGALTKRQLEEILK